MILGKVTPEDGHSRNGLYRQQINRKDAAVNGTFLPENLTPAPRRGAKVQHSLSPHVQELVAVFDFLEACNSLATDSPQPERGSHRGRFRALEAIDD